MAYTFESIHNYNEQVVVEMVMQYAQEHPKTWREKNDLLADVVCVALNRLPPRYIRHQVDFVFYQTDTERLAFEQAAADAVDFAFHFVEKRVMQAEMVQRNIQRTPPQNPPIRD